MITGLARKVKINLSLCLIKHYAMETYETMEVWHQLLTSSLDGGEWSASRPSRFTLGDRASGTYWTGTWVGRRAALDVEDIEHL
jgi:hypothetical protein